LDLEIHRDGKWHACATLEPAGADLSVRGPVSVHYDMDYALANLDARDYRALSVRAPVSLASPHFPAWPSILMDLLPQGAARRRLQTLAGHDLNPWEMMARGAVNPVGNLRVRPATPVPWLPHSGFTLEEMAARGDAFVDYAASVGATVAGATDTQGEAPKFWVVQDEQGQWHPDGGHLPFPIRRYALLKFPVPEAGPRAAQILINEARFQKVATRLGLRVTAQLPEELGAANEGAILLPRFDRRWNDGREVRLGVESMYSVCGVIDSANTALRHDQVLIELAKHVSDFKQEFIEYVRRDLFNLALGNRDNHGRNTALLKDVDGTMALAPLFDFGPSFLDARAIVRVIRWDGEEPGGHGGWAKVVANLDTRFEDAGLEPPRHLFEQAVRLTLPQLPQLPALMRECGVDEEIVVMREPEIERLAEGLRNAGIAS
jgi:serine/threonine-protein kinase HipA